jgi:hypothetical protein
MDTTSSASSNATATAIALTFFAVILYLPLIWYCIQIRRPLRVNSAATRFVGKYRGWRLTHVTGFVLASDRYTRTTKTTTYGNSPSGLVMGSTRTIIDVYDTLTLRLADGRDTQVQVLNFNVTAIPGQVVSFWTARKHSRVFTFALLNHTVNQQNVNDQQVFNIMQPRQILFVLYLFALVLPVTFLSVFGGDGIPFVLWLILLVFYALSQKRVRRQFGKQGMTKIWQISRPETRPFQMQ